MGHPFQVAAHPGCGQCGEVYNHPNHATVYEETVAAMDAAAKVEAEHAKLQAEHDAAFKRLRELYRALDAEGGDLLADGSQAQALERIIRLRNHAKVADDTLVLVRRDLDVSHNRRELLQAQYDALVHQMRDDRAARELLTDAAQASALEKLDVLKKLRVAEDNRDELLRECRRISAWLDQRTKRVADLEIEVVRLEREVDAEDRPKAVPPAVAQLYHACAHRGPNASWPVTPESIQAHNDRRYTTPCAECDARVPAEPSTAKPQLYADCTHRNASTSALNFVVDGHKAGYGSERGYTTPCAECVAGVAAADEQKRKNTAASRWLAYQRKLILASEMWHEPLRNVDPVEGAEVFEWWWAERKLTVYLKDGVATFLQVWGSDPDTQMSQGTVDNIVGLYQWLRGGNGNDDVKRLGADCAKWAQTYDEVRTALGAGNDFGELTLDAAHRVVRERDEAHVEIATLTRLLEERGTATPQDVAAPSSAQSGHERGNVTAFDLSTKRLLERAALSPSGKKIVDECFRIAEMLVEKNIAYGDSALNPVRVFARDIDARAQILVRLDDKLSRLARGSAAGEDVILDLLGYLVLYRIAPAPETAEKPAVDPVKAALKGISVREPTPEEVATLRREAAESEKNSPYRERRRFVECAACAAKPGAPVLCGECLNRRAAAWTP